MRNGLKKIIEDSGLRKGFIAKECGVHPSTLWLWMNNKKQPRSKNRKKLAKILRVPENLLFPKE